MYADKAMVCTLCLSVLPSLCLSLSAFVCFPSTKMPFPCPPGPSPPPPPRRSRLWPRLTRQAPQVAQLPPRRRPGGVAGRVLHLLRECGGHGHLRLRTHVSLLHLRPEAQEDVKRLLPHLPETDQGHHQDLPQHVRTGQGAGHRHAAMTTTNDDNNRCIGTGSGLRTDLVVVRSC